MSEGRKGRKEGSERGARAKFARGAALRREGEGRRRGLDSVARRANGCRRCIDAPKVAATRERSKNGNERNRRFPSRAWKFNLSLSLSSISNHGGERKKSQSRNLEFFARTSEKKRIERDGFWKPRNHLSSSSARGRGEDALILCALE